jgi:hypothetical protein
LESDEDSHDVSLAYAERYRLHLKIACPRVVATVVFDVWDRTKHDYDDGKEEVQ